MNKKSKKGTDYSMPKGHLKGVPRRRGAPILYTEKKQSFNISLTPTALNILSNAARAKGMSQSEMIEQWIKSDLIPPESELT